MLYDNPKEMFSDINYIKKEKDLELMVKTAIIEMKNYRPFEKFQLDQKFN
jgi:hypothetical protein